LLAAAEWNSGANAKLGTVSACRCLHLEDNTEGVRRRTRCSAGSHAYLLNCLCCLVFVAVCAGGPSGPAGTRRHELIVVASLIDKVPNLAGLARTAEVLGAGTLVLADIRVASDQLFTRLVTSTYMCVWGGGLFIGGSDAQASISCAACPTWGQHRHINLC
jgi:hypothetical protein